MFKKVKAKFILVSTIITAFILVFISGGIYFSIRGQTNRNNSQILELVASHSSNFKFYNQQQGSWQGGEIPEEGQPQNSEESQQPNPQNSNQQEGKPDKNKRELPNTAQFFTVVYANGMFITEDVYNMDHIASALLSEDAAKELVAKIKETGKESGTINKYYMYKVANLGNDMNEVTGLAVLDCEQSLKSLDTVRNYSLIFGSLGLIIMFVLLYFFSDKILKPVREAYDKQKNFISNASHELRTPLTIISANNELIEMQGGSNEHTDNITKQIKKMNDMVAGLTLLSKVSDPDSLEMKEINVSNIVEEACMNYEHLYNEMKLNFEFDVQKDVVLKSNDKLFAQLIYILLDNASKYAKNNIKLSLRQNKDVITIQQENEVEKIQQGDLNHYSDRFYRGEDVRGNVEGSGIGLSIAKDIVTLFKGKMNIKGIYNRFTIEIELKK